MSANFYIDIDKCHKRAGVFLKDPTEIYPKILNKKELSDTTFSLRKTQGIKGELCQALYEDKNWYFVRLEDKTLGWALRDEVSIVDAEFRFKISPIGEVFNIAKFPKIDDFRKFLGITYVSGGRTGHGFDCSGFSQMIFRDYFGVYLPKHSWDQKLYGLAVEDDHYKEFDLIFTKDLGDNNANPKLEKGKHVSIYAGGGNIIHSSLGQKGVAITPLKDLLYKFKIVAVRRLVVLKEENLAPASKKLTSVSQEL